MLTPYLEKLILKGQATYRTFVAGGTNRHVLNVGSDRFIIITDLTFYNFTYPDFLLGPLAKALTVMDTYSLMQVRIKSDKSDNVYVFRNNFNFIVHGTGNNQQVLSQPGGSTKLDTYLIHTNDVALIFSLGESTTNVDYSLTKPEGVGFSPITDYGKEGYFGSIPTLNASVGLKSGVIYTPGGDNTAKDYVLAKPVFKEMTFPVDVVLDPIELLNNVGSMPLLQIGYVEILGNPTNISGTI